MAESEVSALKQALQEQYIAMCKLSAELEEERKASASAADEALCMISRLQEEKATEKMEASHYKRMAEEKLRYDEESIAFLQEVLHQKDLEIEFLKCQVRAYEYGLFTTGIGNAHFGLSEVYASIFLNRNSSFSSKRRPQQYGRRNISLPAIQFEKLLSEMSFIDENDDSLLIRKNYEECNMSRRFVPDDCSSDPEQVQEVKLKAKQLMQSSSTIERARSVPGSTNNQLHVSEIDDTNSLRSCSCLKGVTGQDITEVQKCVDGCNISEPNNRNLLEPISGTKHMAANSSKGDELLREAIITCRESFKVGISTSQADIEQLKERLQKLEDDRRIMKQESSERGEEQLKLLREIRDQLDTIQFHVRHLKFKKPPPEEDPMFVSLIEAMLHISI